MPKQPERTPFQVTRRQETFHVAEDVGGAYVYWRVNVSVNDNEFKVGQFERKRESENDWSPVEVFAIGSKRLLLLLEAIVSYGVVEPRG
jgi:hypothetical protein